MRLLFKCIPLFLLLVIASSCKSKKVLSGTQLDNNATVKGVIKSHYKNQLDFKTIRGRIKIDYTNGDQSQGFNVSFRLEKDNAIWISAPLGMVKAYITPEKVSFYNKLDKEFFEGDFTYLSKILGIEVDFNLVQNLLLGQAISNLQKEKYLLTLGSSNYELKPKQPAPNLKARYKIEPLNFRMSLQQFAQPLKDRLLVITYKDYQEVNKQAVPNTIEIEAIEKDNKSIINLEYSNIELNKTLRFPYKVPAGFKKITIK